MYSDVLQEEKALELESVDLKVSKMNNSAKIDEEIKAENEEEVEFNPIMIGPYDLPSREQSAYYLKQVAAKGDLLTYETITPQMSTDIKIFTAVLLFVVILFAILLIILAHFL